MDIFQDIRKANIIIVAFSFDDMSIIRRESSCSGRLITDVMLEVGNKGLDYLRTKDKKERKLQRR